MAGLVQDVRLAVRQLRKSPGFTLSALLMLAMGICAASTALSWINGTLLHPIPTARNTSELVTIMRGTWNISPSPPFSYADLRDLREMNRSFSGILGYHHEWATLTGSDNPQRIYVVQATGNYFDVWGSRPFLGAFGAWMKKRDSAVCRTWYSATRSGNRSSTEIRALLAKWSRSTGIR